MHQSQSIPQPDSQHSDIFHTFSIQPLYRTYSIYNLTSLTKPLLYDAIEISFRILTARSTFVHRAAHIFSAFSLLIDEIEMHLKSDDIFENDVFQEQFSPIFLLKVLYQHGQERSGCGQRTQHYYAPVADLDHFLFSLFDGQFLPIHKMSLFSQMQIMDMN